MTRKKPTANNVASAIADACHGFTFEGIRTGPCGYSTSRVRKGQGYACFDIDLETRDGRFKVTVEQIKETPNDH